MPTQYVYNRPCISELPFASVSKRVLVQLTFHMEMSLICKTINAQVKTNFHMKGCAPGLVLKQRQKATRKSGPIDVHKKAKRL